MLGETLGDMDGDNEALGDLEAEEDPIVIV
jgi:hypothetical protein